MIILQGLIRSPPPPKRYIGAVAFFTYGTTMILAVTVCSYARARRSRHGTMQRSVRRANTHHTRTAASGGGQQQRGAGRGVSRGIAGGGAPRPGRGRQDAGSRQRGPVDVMWIVSESESESSDDSSDGSSVEDSGESDSGHVARRGRSEERRVGKEC